MKTTLKHAKFYLNDDDSFHGEPNHDFHILPFILHNSNEHELNYSHLWLVAVLLCTSGKKRDEPQAMRIVKWD